MVECYFPSGFLHPEISCTIGSVVYPLVGLGYLH